MQKKYFKFLTLSVCSMALSGCSVFMAMHGKQDANLSVLTVGQDRGVVVMNLGEPQKTYVKDGLRVDTHEVQNGNAPSAGRALGHAALDILTFGFWEIIGTPVEGFQGKTSSVTVEYDENDKLVSVNTVTGHVKKERAQEKDKESVKTREEEKVAAATNFGPAGAEVK